MASHKGYDDDYDDPYGGNGGSGGGGNSGGGSGYDDEEDDGSTKTVEFLNFEFEIPYRSSYYEFEEAEMLLIVSGKKYVLLSFAQGVIDDFIYDTSDIVTKMQAKAESDYKVHDYKADCRFSYEGEKQIGKYLFYIFDTGKNNQKFFLLKYNDHYYIQGMIQLDGSTNIDLGLKFVRDIIKSAKNLEDMEEVEEDIYSFYPHVPYFDLMEYVKAEENRGKEEEEE
ncbi:MAG: hypothetical protein IKQ29_00425 [Bacilli bacterium]|nr:hypothetical protein [Bacilli bacterium]